MSEKVKHSAVEPAGENQFKVSIEISQEGFEQALNTAYLRNRDKISLPGFRKGRVPRQMLEAQYGKKFFYEDAMESIFTEVYEHVIKKHGFEPVSRPQIENFDDLDGGGVILEILTFVKPEIEAPDYTGLEYTKRETTADEEEVMQILKDNQDKNARVISVTDRKSQMGDGVRIDFEGFVGGVAFTGGKAENHELVLGSGQFIPGFEEQVAEREIGEEFEVNVNFPDEYHAPELAGKPAVFKCRLNDITARELPELDDEFAQEISDHDTLEEYKQEIRNKLEERNTDRVKVEIENELAVALAGRVEDAIPDSMIEHEADRIIRDFADNVHRQGGDFGNYMQATGMNIEAMRVMYQLQASQNVRARLAIEAIVKKEDIQISDEDMQAELERLAVIYGMDKDAFAESIGEDGRESVAMDLKTQKALAKVKEVAIEVEKTKEETKEDDNE
ncbi:MAG: trigger factor [Defluviitaleaceae bacterium]|nr:trigger factor [Defluviitaleaceae bacterium]